MPTRLIPIQQPLQPPLPTIEGNVDYQRLRDQLLRIDQLLIQSGVEEQFIAASFQDWKARCKFKNIPAKAQRKIQIHARRALRCNLVRTLIMEDFRGFAIRLADSPLFQHFCGLSELDRIQVPSKSTLQRYSRWTDEAAVRRLVKPITFCVAWTTCWSSYRPLVNKLVSVLSKSDWCPLKRRSSVCMNRTCR